MAKLFFNSVVYLKSTLEKVYVRAIISNGQGKKYKLSNGMTVGIDEISQELPVPAGESTAAEIQAGEAPATPETAPDAPETAPETAPKTAPKKKSKPKKADKC